MHSPTRTDLMLFIIIAGLTALSAGGNLAQRAYVPTALQLLLAVGLVWWGGGAVVAAAAVGLTVGYHVVDALAR